MPIAFDAQSQGAAVATSLTIAHTCSASADRVLVLGMMNDGSTDFNPTCTYAGVSATQAAELSSAGQHGYIFVLDDPATGTNNVVWTPSASANMTAGHTSYTGAHAPSNVPDASGTKSEVSVTISTLSVITVADNCWMVSFGYAASDPPNESTGLTQRGVNEGNTAIADSNGAITPAGSYDTAWARSPATTINQLNVSIAPAGATAVANHWLLMGV